MGVIHVDNTNVANVQNNFLQNKQKIVLWVLWKLSN